MDPYVVHALDPMQSPTLDRGGDGIKKLNLGWYFHLSCQQELTVRHRQTIPLIFMLPTKLTTLRTDSLYLTEVGRQLHNSSLTTEASIPSVKGVAPDCKEASHCPREARVKSCPCHSHLYFSKDLPALRQIDVVDVIASLRQPHHVQSSWREQADA